VEGREREGPQVTVEPGPLRALLRHWKTRVLSVLIFGTVCSAKIGYTCVNPLLCIIYPPYISFLAISPPFSWN